MSPQKSKEEMADCSRRMILISIIVSLVIGFLGIIFFSWQASNWPQFLSIASVALMIAIASLFSGGLLGFLFGIPRTQSMAGSSPGPGPIPAAKPTASASAQAPKPETPSPAVPAKPPAAAGEVSYQGNTNLEQISDWLSKILVGAGLTQIASLPPALKSYAQFTAPGLGNFPHSEVFSVGLLIFFVVCGFLVGYLWTRLYLPGALIEAEKLQELESKVSELVPIAGKVSELEEQARIDSKALSLVQSQLNPGTETPTISQEDLNAAVKAASKEMRSQIFYLAQGTRAQNWRSIDTKPRMERTIPIFRALIAADPKNEYHSNHGQLGFALKDQREPNWQEAESELTKAIDTRGPWEEQGWLVYEYNRAICRINLDAGFKENQASDEKSKQNIIADLKAAAKEVWIADLIAKELTIKEWLRLNNLTLGEITGS